MIEEAIIFNVELNAFFLSNLIRAPGAVKVIW